MARSTLTIVLNGRTLRSRRAIVDIHRIMLRVAKAVPSDITHAAAATMRGRNSSWPVDTGASKRGFYPGQLTGKRARLRNDVDWSIFVADPRIRMAQGRHTPAEGFIKHTLTGPGRKDFERRLSARIEARLSRDRRRNFA